MTTTDYTTDPEYRALLESVLANPADDAPRLILSDWLEDHEQYELAKFIRGHVGRKLGPFQSLIGSAITFSYAEHIDFYVRAGDVGSVVVAPAIPGVKWVVRKGFVSEIRLTCAKFVGGTCPHCVNRFASVYNVATGIETILPPCPDCNGTGRIEGLAKELFSRHPITRVVLTDKRPWNATGGFDWDWCFLDASTNDERRYNRDRLPGDLFSMVHQLSDSKRRGIVVAGFPTETDALDALSDACVAYGRNLAGLPQLTFKP